MDAIKVPVLFLVFNRPETTKRVFSAIREAKPSKLYISSDGPRLKNEKDTINCAEVRDIVREIDWDCEVNFRFLDENHGCKIAVQSGIDWFFENEESGIILEDDCLPSSSFFGYCQRMLEKYNDVQEVMQIAGYNPISYKMTEDHTFIGSAMIWGWATWRHAWQHYDLKMKSWPSLRDKRTYLLTRFGNRWKVNQVKKNLDLAHSLKVNTWDYQWNYTILQREGLVVLPKVNLIQNIGFGEGSSHTSSTLNLYSESTVGHFNVEKINFPKKIFLDKGFVRKYFFIDMIVSLNQKVGIPVIYRITKLVLSKLKLLNQ